jgi:hypothetical protein
MTAAGVLVAFAAAGCSGIMPQARGSLKAETCDSSYALPAADVGLAVGGHVVTPHSFTNCANVWRPRTRSSAIERLVYIDRG